MANLIAHFECHMTRTILSREKEEQIIDHLYFMSISILEYIQDIRCIYLHQQNKELSM
jgi:hypothetical protein